MVFEKQKELIGNIENPVIFDIGAWFGDTAEKYLEFFSRPTIYAFEPSKTSYENMISKNLPNYVKPYRFAIGNENKDIEFNINLEQQTNSILETDPLAEKTWGCKACDFVRKEVVPMITIDKFVEENSIECIDILKMDTQGTEYMVLEGAEKTIKENKIKVIFTEIIIMPTYIGQKNLDEALYDYRKNGFVLYNFYGWPVGQLQQIEAIFVHESQYEKIK